MPRSLKSADPMAPSTPSPKKRKRTTTKPEVIDLTKSPSTSPKKSPSKRRKTKADATTEPTPSPERRLRPTRRTPPQFIMVKRERVMTQRMFLVERSGRKNGALEEEFSVLGSTGNVYHVNVRMIPRCTCPDFMNNLVHCKHILFVFLKVLKLPAPLWYQAAFLTSELEEIFTKVEDSRHVVSSRVLEHYKSLKSGTANSNDSNDGIDESGRKSLEGDCPICFEDLSESSLGDTVFCKAMCGNNIHKECFDQWAKSKRQERLDVTCVYCRTPWDDGKGKKADEFNEEGYMNLGKMVGASPTRDTSTYHSWSPWRKRWR